jgi:predicted RecA/RadA family phage recombinase
MTITVNPNITPSVTIAANPGNSITSGASVTFAATPTNGGTTPAYQWKKNGNNVGSNSITYTDAALQNNDIITCVLTSNSPCASPTTATSTGITMTVSSPCPSGTNWTSQNSATDNEWNSVTYGNGVFVAIASSGTGNRVMTSPDGITWTSRTSAANNLWTSVTYGNGLFVAVAGNGAGNRVMTSPDGIIWTSRTSAADNAWQSVTYGNGLFVAVATSGAGNRVMTSPDGITWTSRNSPANNSWYSVTYGNGVFVAVAWSGTGNRVMTSPDGINWTTRASAADNYDWLSVTYGNGLFVAVSLGTGIYQVMTSPDGITWTIRTSAAMNSWNSVTYGNGLFVAVAGNGTGNRVMTSPNGINWTSRTSAADNLWVSVTYGNGVFVAVSQTGTGNRVMTSFGLVTPTFTAVAPICSGATLAALPTTSTNAITGTWSPALNNLATTTYTFTPSVGQCATTTTLTITVNPTPAAPTALAQTFCSAATIANLTATGTGIKWYNVATGGTALISTTALVTGNYFASQTVGTCESARTQVAVSFTEPTAPIIGQSFCGGATIANLTATGTGIKWYNVASGGTALSSTTALTTSTYYVSQSVGGCESARTPIAVTVSGPSTPTGNANQSFTTGATLANIVTNPTAISWYATLAFANTNTNILPQNTVLVNGSTYYGVQVSGTCRSSALAVTVSVSAPSLVKVSSLSVKENSSIKQISIYPNPVTKGELNIAAGDEAIESVTLISLSGAKVISIPKVSNPQLVVLNTLGLVKGTYLIEITTENSRTVRKVIIDNL